MPIYDLTKSADLLNQQTQEQLKVDNQKLIQQAENFSPKSSSAESFWDKNGQLIMDGAGNILDAVTKIVVATQGSYDPNQYYTGPNGYVQYNPYYSRRSSGMSATTKIVLFGAIGAAIIVGAVLYKKNKRKKRREEREREEEYEYRRTSKRHRR